MEWARVRNWSLALGQGMGRGPGHLLSTLTDYVMSYRRLFVANIQIKRKEHEYKASQMHEATLKSKKRTRQITMVAKQKKRNDKSLLSDKDFTQLMNI